MTPLYFVQDGNDLVLMGTTPMGSFRLQRAQLPFLPPTTVTTGDTATTPGDTGTTTIEDTGLGTTGDTGP